MFAVALAITGSEDEASDAVQTAMMRIWEMLNDKQTPEYPMSYCISTVRNICINELRRNKSKVPIEDNAERASESCDAEDFVELNEVVDAVARLPHNERRAVQMSAYAGCSSQEIAKAMGISSVNARQILSRGRKRLRSYFTK